MTKKEAVFTTDRENKTISMVKSFDADLEQVWRAWSESEILDQWWAPKPYRAETKSMDFRVGGSWLYCMLGPEGDRTWCKEQYEEIEPLQKIFNRVNFCDEEGTVDKSFPLMHWKKNFRADTAGTTVSVLISFDKESDMDTIVGMGFQGGFTMGLNNLDEYLQKLTV